MSAEGVHECRTDQKSGVRSASAHQLMPCVLKGNQQQSRPFGIQEGDTLALRPRLEFGLSYILAVGSLSNYLISLGDTIYRRSQMRGVTGTRMRLAGTKQVQAHHELMLSSTLRGLNQTVSPQRLS